MNSLIRKLNATIRDSIELENAKAQIAQSAAKIDYIAMMADIDFPEGEKEDA